MRNGDLGFYPAGSGLLDSESPAPRDRPVSPTTDKTAANTGTGAVDGLVWLDDLLAPLEAGGEESVSIEDADETEVEPLKVATGPKLPGADAVEQHRRLHIPYRAWCKFCVMGQGSGDQHRSGPESTIPKIEVDYFLINSGGLKGRKELEMSDEAVEKARSEGEVLKCLTVRCYSTKSIWGNVVPVKGADEDDFAANCAVTDILCLGHTQLILKGDNEPAPQALIARSLEVLRIRTADDDSVTKITKEDPAPYDSQGNGGIEVGVVVLRDYSAHLSYASTRGWVSSYPRATR